MNEPLTIEAAQAALDAAMAKSRAIGPRLLDAVDQLAKGQIDAKACRAVTNEARKATREANKCIRDLKRLSAAAAHQDASKL